MFNKKYKWSKEDNEIAATEVQISRLIKGSAKNKSEVVKILAGPARLLISALGIKHHHDYSIEVDNDGDVRIDKA